jgi:hypothetical protein
MARRKNAPESIRVKHGLSERLRLLRTEFYGERGGPDVARTLGIPVRTWYNYENGVTVPAEIILRVVELTSVEPVWLLRGEGPKFRENSVIFNSPRTSESKDGLASSSVTTLLRVALERLKLEEQTAHDLSFGPPRVNRREEHCDATNLGLDSNVGELDREDRSPEVDRQRGALIYADSPDSHRAFLTLRVTDDSMAPIVAAWAHVGYAEPEVVSKALHDRLVVVRIEGSLIVRWFQHCGRFGLLRAENPGADPSSILIDFERDDGSTIFHRVLWISTPH